MIDTALYLIANILPLYVLVGLGYIGGRWLDVHLRSLSSVIIYLIAPLVSFGAMMQLKLNPEYFALPLTIFCAAAVIGFVMYRLARAHWHDTTANLIAMGSVTGNTGYFGFPLILALFSPEQAGLYLFMNVALTLSESGLGYYMGARGNADFRTAVKRVLRLPVIHAVWLGLLLNMLGFELPPVMGKYWNYATGAWVFIGMMLIGVALSKQKKLEFDLRLMAWMFAPKFILWPLVGFSIIACDAFLFHALDADIYKMIAIFTSVPLAGNVVAFAANLDLHPERAAATVLASTFFAILTVPGALALATLIFG